MNASSAQVYASVLLEFGIFKSLVIQLLLLVLLVARASAVREFR